MGIVRIRIYKILGFAGGLYFVRIRIYKILGFSGYTAVLKPPALSSRRDAMFIEKTPTPALQSRRVYWLGYFFEMCIAAVLSKNLSGVHPANPLILQILILTRIDTHPVSIYTLISGTDALAVCNILKILES